MVQTARLVIEIDSREAERRSQALRTELGSIQRTGDFASRSMDQMSVATRQLAGYMAGLVTVGAAVSKMDIYTGLNNRIKLVTSSQQDLNQALKDTFNIAQATGQAWDSTAQVYQRFADNAKRLGITLQQTASLTDTVAKAISISGGSAASAEAALVQFGQALASGVLRGEEFNSIAEQAPALLKAIATGLNTNIGALRGMAAEGKLTGEVVIQALTKAKTSVDDLFGKTDFTIGQSLTQLSNAVTKFVGEAGKGSGAAQALSGSIQLLANNLETVTNIAMIGGAYWMGTFIPVMYKSVVASAEKVKALLAENQAMNAAIVQTQRKAQAEYNAAQADVSAARAAVAAAEMEVNANRAVIQSEIQRIQTTIAATNAEKAQEAQSLRSQITDKGRAMSISRMATLQKSQALMTAELTALEQKLASTTVSSSATYTAARNTQTVATERLTVATSELNVANSLTTRSSVGLLAALGGPVGLGLTVAGVAASYLLLKDNTDSATEALDVQKISVRELTEEYQKMSLAKLLTEIDSLKSKLADAKKTQSKALIELQSVAPSLGNQSTDKQRKQAEVLSGIIKDLRNEAITTDKALQQMSKAGFSDDQLTRASKAFVKFDEVADTISIVNAQLGLAESSSSKATDGYESASKQIAELNKEYGRLNSRLDTSKEAFETVANLNLTAGARAGASAVQFKEASDALEKFTKGRLSASEVAQVFNANLPIPKETIDSFIKQAAKIDENKSALDKVNSELKKQNSLRDTYLKQSQGILAARQDETKELNNQLDVQQKLNALKANYSQKNLEADFITLNTKLFGNNKAGLDRAMAVSEFYKENKIPMTRSLSTEEWRVFEKYHNKQVELKKLQESITDSEREQTKELEKQQKILSVNAKVQANASKFGFSNIESKYKLPEGTLSAIHMIESRGNAKAYNKDTGATGGFQFLSGTAKQYGVKDRTDLAQSAEGAGKYMSYLLKLFKGDLEKAVRAYHAGEGNVQKGKGIGKYNNQYWKDFQGYMAGINGYSAGDISSKDFSKMLQDDAKMAEEQARLRIQLENEVADQQTKIRNDLARKLEEVDKANFSLERKAEIIADLKARADNDIAIAQQALRTKLDDFKEFQKTEIQLLEESFARKKFNAAHDIELSKAEQKQAVELLKQQYQQELGLMQLAQEQRLFQAKSFLLSETEAIQTRYRLEREEISKTTKDEEEKRKRLALSRNQERLESLDRAVKAAQVLASIQADLNGVSDLYRQNQDRTSRMGAALNLADSKRGVVDSNERSSLDVIKAQYEQQLISLQEFEDQKTAIMQAALEQRNLIYDEYSMNARDIEGQYQQERLNTQIMYGQQMMGSVTSMFGSMFGEQSKAYKIMFAADKAYAIAASGIAIQQGISKAMALGWPANIGVMAQVIAQGASIISNIRAIKDQGFANGGYTGKGGKYEVAGSVHKGEIVWSQDDIKRWGGVNLVENMRKSANPEAFLKNNSAENIMRRAQMSSNAFMESQKKSNIFNQSGDGQIIYKANQATESSKISTGSDLYHDGKVYFSPKGLVQDRSNLEDVYDFTLGRSARPQAEALASVQPLAPTINFKIEVVNQVKGATVEAEQLDENTVRLIVKDELKKELPREVPKIVSDQIKEPNSPISRAISTNTTARRNR